MAGETDSDCLRNRLKEAEIFLGRSEAAGFTEDQIMNNMVGPVVYRVIFQSWSFTDETAEKLVGNLFALRRPE